MISTLLCDFLAHIVIKWYSKHVVYRIPIQFAFTLLTIKIKSISLFKRCFRYLVRFFFLTFMFSFSHLLVECIAELHPVKDHYPEALAWCLNYRNDESFSAFRGRYAKDCLLRKYFGHVMRRLLVYTFVNWMNFENGNLHRM